MKSIAQALTELVAAEKEVESAEAALKAAKEHVRHLEHEVLPSLFDEADAAEYTLSDGTKARRTLIVTGSLPRVDERADHATRMEQAAARGRALDWAHAVGWGPLIKCTVEAQYDRGDIDKAREVFARLRGDNSAKVSFSETIHPQTLAAQVRYRIREGKDVPFDMLGVDVVRGVKLTKRPKETV